MAERLISLGEASQRLGWHPRTIYKRLANLRAQGLQVIKIGSVRKCREASLDRLIKQAGETEKEIG